MACLQSASISILVNGSPTKEFKLGRGVRQGDPLSPFLFILATEGLNALTKSVLKNNMFEGVEIGRDKSFIKTIGDGGNTAFWSDAWASSIPFEQSYNRLFRLERNRAVRVKERQLWDGNTTISAWDWIREPTGRTLTELQQIIALIASIPMDHSKSDSWKWELSGNGLFSTNKLSKLIDSKVFIWRARKKRLPTLYELDKRGIDLNSVRCQLCDDDIESVDHALVFCKHVFEIWEKVFDWWGVNLLSSISINELFQGSSNSGMTEFGSKLWQAITWATGYLIWHNRNQKIFNNKAWTAPIALCDIQVKSFDWVAKRCREKKIDWHNWVHNPHIFLV
ncbi:uncharacterized protein [Rutidosis leptorrhynchoides]|uniref:uncharacterized protein n=1 Tax=Rutidosis leptorrhynchoides TaxID=125765 RepID=UPI003A999F61